MPDETRIESWAKRQSKSKGLFFEIRLRAITNEIPDYNSAVEVQTGLENYAKYLIGRANRKETIPSFFTGGNAENETKTKEVTTV